MPSTKARESTRQTSISEMGLVDHQGHHLPGDDVLLGEHHEVHDPDGVMGFQLDEMQVLSVAPEALRRLG